MMQVPDQAWIPFRYFGYWDVPLVFTLRRGKDVLLFERAFDETLDDYDPCYTVSSVPAESYPPGTTGSMLKDLPWMRIGEVPVSGLTFDPTRRSCVSLESLAGHACLGIPSVP